jgi:magnesium-transporting ATPase (P-type)
MGVCFALGTHFHEWPSQKSWCRLLLACTCAAHAKEFKARFAATSETLMGAKCFAYNVSVQASTQILPCACRRFRLQMSCLKNCAYLLQVTVLRDAEVQDISIFDLLVGDVMLFETGDIMPADAVIITGNTIRYTTM